MPHLILNRKGWDQLETEWHVHGCSAIADFIGLTTEEVREVLEGQHFPDARFVAACLAELPARFEDLFEVVPPTRLSAITAA